MFNYKKKTLKIFQLHNNYKYFGGEDTVVDEEFKILRDYGHNVYQILRDNKKEIVTFKNKLFILKNLSFSNYSIKILENSINKYGRPDVVHVHNTFPLWTYSIFEYLYSKRIPVIFTLHNYRTIFYRLNFFGTEAKKFGLFKNSKILTYLISKLLHRNKNSLLKVDKFITHSQFTYDIFSKHGIKKKKLVIKPNFSQISRKKIISTSKKKNALYVSRLSKEKGILTLLNVYTKINFNLDIIGDGPLLNKVNQNQYNIRHIKNISRKKVLEYIRTSKFVIYPSEWYEIFGMTIIEAFNLGTLVLASNIGSISTIIKHKKNGLLFKPGDKLDLINKINWIYQNPKKCDEMVLNAKKDFIKKYSAKENYLKLMKIYNEAIKKKK